MLHELFVGVGFAVVLLVVWRLSDLNLLRARNYYRAAIDENRKCRDFALSRLDGALALHAETAAMLASGKWPGPEQEDYFRKHWCPLCQKPAIGGLVVSACDMRHCGCHDPAKCRDCTFAASGVSGPPS